MADHASSISSTVNLLVKSLSRATPPGPTKRILGPPRYRSCTTDNSPPTVHPLSSVSDTRCCFLEGIDVTIHTKPEPEIGGHCHPAPHMPFSQHSSLACWELSSLRGNVGWGVVEGP